MANYKPGQYTFEITGTVGSKSEKVTFIMTLKDPCPTTSLTINNPTTFINEVYTLRDPSISRIWDIDTIISRDTLIDCGLVTVIFIDTNTGTTPDPTIFFDERINLNSFNYATQFNDVVDKKGDYPIKFTVYHTSYPLNSVSKTFTVKVLDPCEAPKGITPSILKN